jgi:hypothetical protein
MKDLFPEELNVPVAEKKEQKLTKVAEYDYVDATGKLLFQKIRYVDQDGKKTFRQRRQLEDGSWSYSLGDTPKVLYNLPAVAAAVAARTPVYVVEGEKDAETLMSRGLVATTMPGGAGPGKWLPLHTETLAGGLIEVIADNDEAGKMHAANVYKALQEAGCDVAVWVSEKVKDITEHLDAGLNLDDLVPLNVNEVPEYDDTVA